MNEVKLKDIIQFNPPESIKKNSVVKKISMEKLSPHTKKITGFENAAYFAGPKFKNDDTLLAKITPCLENGKTAFVDILDENEVAFGSSEFIVLRAIENKSDANYIYYLARSPKFRNRAIGCMEGTSGRKRVNDKALQNETFDIPNIQTQSAIARVLSFLDDKIELNNKINKELETVAKELYDYWFVQFDFSNEKGKPYKTSGGKMVYNEVLKREIPKGWEVKSLRNIANIETGKEDANFATPDGHFKFFTCGRTTLQCNKPAFKGNAILLAGNGDFNVKHYTGEFNAYQRTYVIIPEQSVHLQQSILLQMIKYPN